MIAILGAGLAGLQLGRRLKERGADFLILEKGSVIGGLCRTMRSGEYSWDIGPHGFYSKYPEAMRYYHELPVSYSHLERRVKVCHHGPGGRIYELGYPFENGLVDLPFAQRLECVAGYCAAAWRRSPGESPNLRRWIEDRLGPGIARHFMLPYNEKIWDFPLEKISLDLVQQKIDPGTPWTIVRNALTGGGVGRAYQARFLYPTLGAGAIPDAVAEGLRDRLHLNFAIARIERGNKGLRVVSSDGRSVSADVVVSTIPIPELLAALGDRELNALGGLFPSNDTYFIAIGLRRGSRFGRFSDCQWVFFAGGEIFYRVSLMHNFADSRPPLALAEITRKGAARELTPGQAVDRVMQDLRSCGMLADEKSVHLAQAHLERYTYPIQAVGLAAARADLEGRLERERIYLLGRSGRWDYLNTDGVFLQVDEFMAGSYGALAKSVRGKSV